MNKKSDLTDSKLISLYLSGDGGAFEKLLYRYKNSVYGYIYSLVKDRDLADDFFQDTFIKVVTLIKQGAYLEQGYFYSWVCRLARNMIIDHFRRNKQIFYTSNDSGDIDFTAKVAMDAASSYDMMIDKDRREELRLLLSLLPKEQRQIVILRYYYDMSFKQIAEILNISINTALGRARYAMINIRKKAKERELLVD